MTANPGWTEPTATSRSRRAVLKWGATAAAGAVLISGGNSALAASIRYDRPNKLNTGVPAGTRLTRHDGDITVTARGTILDSLDIHGRIRIRAANVQVRRCRVRGSNNVNSNTGLVDCNHPDTRNALIEDCYLVPDYPSVWLDGVIGKEYTARRNNVFWTVDGFGAYNITDPSAPANVRIEQNFIHDLAYFSRDPNHDNGPTHNDGIQVQGGDNIRIEGNTVIALMSRKKGTLDYPARNVGQGILIQPNVAPIRNSRITNNWIYGGKAGIYVLHGDLDTMKFGECTGNHFGRDQYQYHGGSTYQLRVQRGVTFSNDLTENVWADTGERLWESRNGGIRYT